jgi:hypothetical protein
MHMQPHAATLEGPSDVFASAWLKSHLAPSAGTGVSMMPANPDTSWWNATLWKTDPLYNEIAFGASGMQFFLGHHTFTHENMNNVTYNDAYQQIRLNQVQLSAAPSAAPTSNRMVHHSALQLPSVIHMTPLSLALLLPHLGQHADHVLHIIVLHMPLSPAWQCSGSERAGPDTLHVHRCAESSSGVQHHQWQVQPLLPDRYGDASHLRHPQQGRADGAPQSLLAPFC